MRPRLHPALRALWALGGTPAAAAARLEAATGRLHELTRDDGALTLLSDRLLDGITRGIDLGAVLRATEPLDRPAPGPDASAARGALPSRPSPVRAPVRVQTSRVPRPRATLDDEAMATRATLDDEALAARAGAAEDTPALGSKRARSLVRDDHDGPAERTRWGRPIDDVERRHPAITAAQAIAALRDRATRAGHVAAADTPVGGTAAPEVAALLAPANPRAAARASATVIAPSEREGAGSTGRPVPPDDAGARSPLARAIARAESTRAQRVTSRSVSPQGARTAFTLAAPPAGDDIAEPRPHAPEPVTGGFRGLAMRAAELDPGRRTPALETETTLSALAVERMTDAALGQRITRLLQREARRHGIALGMVEP